MTSRSINFETVFLGPLTFVLCHLGPSALTLVFLVHELLKWFTAGPRMHARTSAFCVGGAMPAFAAITRLPGMHVCFPARIMTGLVHFGPANRLSGPVVSRHPAAAPVAGSPRRGVPAGAEELHRPRAAPSPQRHRRRKQATLTSRRPLQCCH